MPIGASWCSLGALVLERMAIGLSRMSINGDENPLCRLVLSRRILFEHGKGSCRLVVGVWWEEEVGLCRENENASDADGEELTHRGEVGGKE